MNRPGKEWLAGYLYYAEPWEDFLIRAVKPFLDSVFDSSLAEQFFFIRYWERGPHIRLRFFGESDRLQRELKSRMETFFYDFFKEHPSERQEPAEIKDLPEGRQWFDNNSLQFIHYEPEVQRYGGPVGIRIAERQFEISSEAVLAVIGESGNWDYERALGAAIQLHLGFAFALSMDLNEAAAFFSRIFTIWFGRSYGYAPGLTTDEIEERRDLTLKAFNENFEGQKAVLVPFHQTLWNALSEGVLFEQEWLNQWLRGMEDIGRELRQAQEAEEIEFPGWFTPSTDLDVPVSRQYLWSILESYVHMTNNRLGILNRDEAYLGYLIRQSLEAIHKP
jgi:hypothetical protein